MRIRQVKPGFWTDVRIAGLPAPVRLFYIGLWMQADDGGWFRWDVPQIAAELYGFEGRAKRERSVAAFGDALEDAGRLQRFPCGHAFIATLTGHQRLSGTTKQVLTVGREHERDCPSPRVPAGSRTSPHIPASPRPVRNGKERELVREQEQGRNGLGTVHARKRADDETESEFRRRVGVPAAMGGKS